MHIAFDVLPDATVNFDNYVAKKPIQNDKVILNGNRLMFIEPLEANAVECYLRWTNLVSQWIFDGRSKSSILKKFNDDILEHQNFILWHYAFGSKYDSPFWNYAIDLAKRTIDDPYFHDKITKAANSSWHDVKIKEVIDQKPAFGPWRSSSIKYWIDGVC